MPLCRKYASGVSRYVRRYIEPQVHPETGPADDLAFDVITELWFEDEATFKGTLKYLSSTIMPEEITADESQFLDRSSFRMATVVECD